MSRGVAYKNDNSDYVLELSPIVMKYCAGHNSTLSDIIMILDKVVEDIK